MNLIGNTSINMKFNYTYLFFLCCFLLISCKSARNQTNVLYYSSESVDENVSELQVSIRNQGWNYATTSNSTGFSEDSLKNISAVVIRLSDINSLDYRAIPHLKRYLEVGGGIVAIRDTSLNDKGWPWLSAWLENGNDASLNQDKGRLAIVGKAYTHKEIQDALTFAIGKNKIPDFSDAVTLTVPDSSRYVREVLVESMDEPLQMAILPNEDVLFIERKGGVKLYENSSGETKTIANFDVFSGIEDGLLGVAIDPQFEKNNWTYFYFAVAGEKYVSRLSRFELHGDRLVLESEKVILEIPTQRTYCCHSAGYIAFDKEGLLYLSTGDNTNAEETEGYTPVDQRPGRQLSDDQGTAANTNDLRGKILRIKVLPNGKYSIPDGNLFPKDGSSGRPEIYVMGARNPFRYSIDPENGYLYFGDVGPDTKVKASTGELMSFDEVNQVRKSGNYGWPYFLGNNDIFPLYNFETKKEGPGKDPKNPINSSPNNTGARVLPPAKPAMIWYGKGNSTKFPLVGNGGASIMVGPIFNSKYFSNSPYRLSNYYDGKLLIYEWIRGWIMAVTFDENGNYLRMEPFLEHLKFDAPVDVQFASDGSVYVLEYGTNWFSKNTNAKIVRIRYADGNRNPTAVIENDKQYGGVPMRVQLSAKKSNDFDQGDQLSYSWNIEGSDLKGDEVEYTFNKAGVYEVVLTVTDNHGGVGKATRKISAGNTRPEISIATKANRTFYFDGTHFDYNVKIVDKEEQIVPERVAVSFGYMPYGKDAATVLSGNQDVGSLKYLKGAQLVGSLDCKSCHSVDKESIGPTYTAIADRYSGEKGSKKFLSEKIINGGSGNWGERAMTPHPEVSTVQAEDMVGYILSLKDRSSSLPLKDVIVLEEHVGKGSEGAYLLNATYKDHGANGIEELQGRDYILLKNPILHAEDFDSGDVRVRSGISASISYIDMQNANYIKFNSIDLTHVKQLYYQVQQNGVGGTIDLHLDKIDGQLISSTVIPNAKTEADRNTWNEFNTKIKLTEGKHDLFFVFKGKDENKRLFNLNWIRFSNK